MSRPFKAYLCQVMQRIIIFLLLCSVIGQASIRTMWTLHYQWNRAAYIAQCENKNKPKLHCDGKCALKKQMTSQEKSDPGAPQLPDSFREIKDIQLFFEEQSLPSLPTADRESAMALPPYQVYLPEASVSGVFRPPAA